MRKWMTSLLAAALAVALATGAWAAGSTSSSSTRSVADSLDKAERAIKAGDYQDAIPILEDVVEQDSENADAYNYLGFAHRKLGNYGGSKTYYDQALSIDPDHKGANEYLGELYLKLGQLEKAEAQLARLDGICTFGCEELDDLKAAIETYKTGGDS